MWWAEGDCPSSLFTSESFLGETGSSSIPHLTSVLVMRVAAYQLFNFQDVVEHQVLPLEKLPKFKQHILWHSRHLKITPVTT
jgi:hypothetical protein